MSSYYERFFQPLTYTGYWEIHDTKFSEKYWGNLSYDPTKSLGELNLYGISIEELKASDIITGIAVTGEKITVFNSVVTNWTLNFNDSACKKTTIHFISFWIGEEFFLTKESLLLKKFVFSCTNLENWSMDTPLQASRTRRSCLLKFVFPSSILLYEDDFVQIKLNTTLNSQLKTKEINIAYLHTIDIKAKYNRKLPYYGNEHSFSYYERIIHDFFCLMIGKNCISFQHMGYVNKKEIISSDSDKKSKKKKNSYTKVEMFNTRSIESKWLTELLPPQMYICHKKVKDNLQQLIYAFFYQYSKFGFILDDWCGMRNCSSYMNYSLPKMIYNFEGLHRSLYPECDTHNGYNITIKAIHAVAPFKDFDNLIQNKNHKLPLRQRLQNILLVKFSKFYDFLSVEQRNEIIKELVDTRNNAAHRDKAHGLQLNRIVSRILLCEEMIAIMIFSQIGLEDTQIFDMLQDGQERNTLKDMLLDDFGGKSNE